MSTQLRASRWPQSGFTAGVFLLAAVGLAGCGGGGEDSTVGYVTVPGGTPTRIVINSPAQIAQVSADNYDDNVNGVISGTTLMRWIDDWATNRPAGITGRLIILQVSNGPAGNEYITPNPAGGVLTYSVPSSRLTMSRSNGVTTTRSMVPDGAAMDAFLSDYGIDPTKDMLVCAMGTGSGGNAMSMGRCWYMLRYWGVEANHLAQLNGGANSALVMDPAYRGPTASCDENTMLTPTPAADCLPHSGYISVRGLPQDNTALQATLSDVIDLVEGRTSAFLWDARSTGQYLGAPMSAGIFQNQSSRQGHPKGAYVLEYTNLLMGDGSWRYKDKADLQAYLDGDTVDGNQFGYYDAGAVIPLGTGNAYQGGTIVTYCETTFRAMITGTAAGVILGKPVRYYDGAMVEWNAMTGDSVVVTSTNAPILPANSPWRTDTPVRSVYNYSTLTIAPRQIDDPYWEADKARPRADAIILADKNYKRGGGGDDIGGAVLPPSPCGG